MRISDTLFSRIKGQNKGQAKTGVLFWDILSVKAAQSRENRLISERNQTVGWLRGKDLNQRPPGYEPDELPAALPRDIHLCSFELRYNTTVAIICQYLLLTFFGNIFLCRNFAMSGLIVEHLTKLRLVQLPVDAAARQELVMGPLLGDDAILDDKDAVSFQNR